MKINLLILSLVLAAFGSQANAQEYLALNEPTFLDEDASGVEVFENALAGTAANQRNTNAVGPAPFDANNAPLVQNDTSIKRFHIMESDTALSDRIGFELEEKNISVDKMTFKRIGGMKTFGFDQVKKINLNVNFTVQSIEVNEENQQFTAVLKPAVGTYTIEVNGDYSPSIKVPALVRNVSKGYNITQDDIELKYFPKDKISSDSVTDVDALIGKTATRALIKGNMVSQEDIRSPVLISKNSTVSAIYRSNSIEVKALAVAQEDGSEGDIIKLKNFDSGKLFKAVVQADGTVYIGTNMGDINVSSNQPSIVNNIN